MEIKTLMLMQTSLDQSQAVIKQPLLHLILHYKNLKAEIVYNVCMIPSGLCFQRTSKKHIEIGIK